MIQGRVQDFILGVATIDQCLYSPYILFTNTSVGEELVTCDGITSFNYKINVSAICYSY